MSNGAVMDIVSVREAIEWQADHAEKNGAPGTARIVRALLALGDSDAATARRIMGWEGLSLRDAMPLRIAGGLHNLLLTGDEPRLADVYEGRALMQDSIDALVRELVERWDARLLPWLDGPPQTNEAGRSASIMAGLMWLCERIGARMTLFEIGASAGINTMLDRYRFELGGIGVGPAESPMRIAPEWRGKAPPDCAPEIVSVRGCDIQPVDLTDEASALRLKSYVWPEASQRMGRIDAAVALAQEAAPDVVAQVADDFVAQFLAEPAPEGTARVLFHSIVWQYIPDEAQARIEAAMAEAAAAATADTPLAWVMLETNRETFAHELRVRYWPNGGEEVLLGQAHPHGAWVEWAG